MLEVIRTRRISILIRPILELEGSSLTRFFLMSPIARFLAYNLQTLLPQSQFLKERLLPSKNVELTSHFQIDTFFEKSCSHFRWNWNSSWTRWISRTRRLIAPRFIKQRSCRSCQFYDFLKCKSKGCGCSSVHNRTDLWETGVVRIAASSGYAPCKNLMVLCCIIYLFTYLHL